MEEYRLIDTDTVSKLRMTPEEAEAVLELWGIQNRLAPGAFRPGAPVPAGLIIPPDEVKACLAQVRGTSSRRFRPARSIGADVRLSIIAAGVLFVAAVGFSIMMTRNRNTYSSGIIYPGYSGPYGYGNDFGDRISPNELQNRSLRPPHFEVSVGGKLIRLKGGPIKAELPSLSQNLRTAVGGPLAIVTSLSPTPLSPEAIDKAIASRPTPQNPEPYQPGMENSGRLVEWKSVEIAYGGKLTKADVPYALVSDKALRTAVQAEQERVIANLAESALTLTGGLSTTTDTPVVVRPRR